MWSETARYPDFFGLDARAVIPFSIWLFHWSMTTFYIAVIGMAFFWLALRRGDTPSTFISKCFNGLFRGDRSHIDVVTTRRRARW